MASARAGRRPSVARPLLRFVAAAACAERRSAGPLRTRAGISALAAKAMSVKRLLLVAASTAAALSATAFARTALAGTYASDPDIDRAAAAAVRHLNAVGVDVGPFSVTTPDEPTLEGDLGGRPAVAYATVGEIALGPFVAEQVRRFGVVLRQPRGRRRLEAWRRCAMDAGAVSPPGSGARGGGGSAGWCDSWAVVTLLHELVHVARFNHGAMGADDWFEEGLAESVAFDQYGPFMWRALGEPQPLRDDPGYPGWTERVRLVSARAAGASWWLAPARRWRIAHVALG